MGQRCYLGESTLGWGVDATCQRLLGHDGACDDGVVRGAVTGFLCAQGHDSACERERDHDGACDDGVVRSKCGAYGPNSELCDLRAGHTGPHSVTLTWEG